jgi:O-antigen/teichoic acid export membrane protein
VEVEALPSLWASARPLFVVELAQAALLSLPIFALGHFASQLAVSQFSIANRLTMLVSTVVLSIGSIVAPAFARHHRRGEDAELRQVNRQTLMVSAGICLPLIAVMVVFAQPLLTLLGSPSRTTVEALYVLCVGQLVFCLFPCRDTLLAMTGHGDVLRRVSLAQCAVAAVLCGALIPAYGVMGAAIASSAIWALGAIGCGVFVARLLPRTVGLPAFRFARG